MVVDAVQGQQPVGEVGDQQQHDAAREQVERGLAATGVEREPHDGADEDDVADGVRDRDDLPDRGQVVLVQVRRHQRDPCRQREADREDQAVDQAAAVAAAVASPYEQQQPGHHHRVHRDVERVAWRRERHLRAEQVRIAVGVEVAEPEQRRAGREQQPRQPRRGLVQADADEDREHRREPDQVHQRAAALQRRDARRRARTAARRRRGRRPTAGERSQARPVMQRPRPARGGARAAQLAALDQLLERGDQPSTSSSVFAAVSWTRKPTSSFGTSG